MKISVIYGYSEASPDDLKYIENLLGKYDIESSIMYVDDLEKLDKDIDLIITIGGDDIILKTLLYLYDKEIPLLSLYGRRSRGFLYVAGINLFPELLNEIIRRNYIVEDRVRLAIKMGSKTLPPVLNDAVILSKVSGRLIRYSLYINNEFIWRDDADGVIVSTPTGSTAYALSAGGSIIKDANVFEIVPINTLIPTHKPIVTSSKNRILICDLTPDEYILILDGQIRIEIDTDKIEFYRSKYRARFIKLRDSTNFSIDKRLVRRMIPSAEADILKDMPPSAKLIYKVLEYEGPLTYRELLIKSGLPARTLRYALNKLLSRGIIIKSHLDRDVRKMIYMLKK